MENYIVSARKYRPSTFESVVGQRALTTTLKNAIATGKLAHAYLFCGPRGVGKTTCARIFAKTINCMSPTADGEACNQCESCTAFNEQRSYNIHRTLYKCISCLHKRYMAYMDKRKAKKINRIWLRGDDIVIIWNKLGVNT